MAVSRLKPSSYAPALLLNLVEHFCFEKSKRFNTLGRFSTHLKILTKALAEFRGMRIYYARVGEAVHMEVVILWNR